jgi:hypothetical protein
MKRRLLNSLAAASLLLLGMTVALWALSYPFPAQGVADKFVDASATRMLFYAVDSSRGTLGFSYESEFGHFGPFFNGWKHTWECPPEGGLYSTAGTTLLDLLGLHIFHQSWQGGSLDNCVLEFRYWNLLVLFAVVAAISIWRILKLRAVGDLICKNCGYDLRATPDRCPECGTIPSKTETISH